MAAVRPSAHGGGVERGRDGVWSSTRRFVPWGLLWVPLCWFVLWADQQWWTVFHTWNDFGTTPEWRAAWLRMNSTVTTIAIVTTVAAPVLGAVRWWRRLGYWWTPLVVTGTGMFAMWLFTLCDARVLWPGG